MTTVLTVTFEDDDEARILAKELAGGTVLYPPPGNPAAYADAYAAVSSVLSVQAVTYEQSVEPPPAGLYLSDPEGIEVHGNMIGHSGMGICGKGRAHYGDCDFGNGL